MSSKDDFNKSAGYRAYGVISGAVFSVCLAVFSFAKSVQPDSNSMWIAGTVIGIAGLIGSGYEIKRLFSDLQKNAQDKDISPKP